MGEIAQATVDQFARPSRGAKGKVVGLHEGNIESSAGSIEGNTAAGDAPADDKHVDDVTRLQVLEVSGTASRREVGALEADRSVGHLHSLPGRPAGTRWASSPRWETDYVDAQEHSLTRWGSADETPAVEDRVRDYLTQHVGLARPWPRVDPRAEEVPPSRMRGDVVSALIDIVGAENVSVEPGARLGATGGASFADYARRRTGDVSDVPDLVVRPGHHDEVVRILTVLSAQDVAVVPVGGGTSVVGGLRMSVPRVALVLDRLGDLLDLDPVSGIATIGPGVTGPCLEALLAARGFTLGHLPQSWERASMGGYAATRSAGQASTGYGRSDEMIESLVVATPMGTMDVGRAPSSAAGPDLRGLLIGSEGALGVITRLRLRVRRLPDTRIYDAAILPGFAAGVAAFRDAAQSRATADVMRLSDEAETATTLLMSGPTGLLAAGLDRYLRVRGVDREGASLAILGWEGTDRDLVTARRAATWRALRRHGAVSLGHRPGESWRRHRFAGPFLRDALMDAGYLVETLETATHWNGYLDLHADVNQALHSALQVPPGPYVMSHLSHVYETGASLYTTVIAVADQADPLAQWARAKSAATDAIMESNATVTHHHAVGRDHAPWLEAEIGSLGIDVLRATKHAVDPRGVLNPGVLGL